jgi:hypothetical protein
MGSIPFIMKGILMNTGQNNDRVGSRVVALRVHDLDTTKSQHVQFIAFRENLWVGSYNQIEKVSENIIETILKSHPKREQLEEYVSNHSDDNACNFVKDYIPDALCGYYDRKTRQISLDTSYSATSSPLVKRVTEALRAKSVEQTYADERTRVYKRNKIKGDWDFSQPFYHGTSSEYFEGIVRLGLKPMPHQTNYENIVHEDAIFLTPVWGEAESHAFHTAGGGYSPYGRRRQKSFIPMVVSVTVPDPARVIPDYDVDREADDAWYNQSNDPQRFYSVSSEKASKHAGLFGYQGRIPSKFIQALYFYSFYEKKWTRLKPDKFAQAVNGVQNWGAEFWHIRLGYPEGEM